MWQRTSERTLKCRCSVSFSAGVVYCLFSRHSALSHSRVMTTAIVAAGEARPLCHPVAGRTWRPVPRAARSRARAMPLTAPGEAPPLAQGAARYEAASDGSKARSLARVARDNQLCPLG